MQVSPSTWARLLVLASFFEVIVSGNGPLLAEDSESKQKLKFAIVIHGGALDDVDGIPAPLRAKMEDALRDALTVGRDILAKNGTSLDAVEQVVRMLEDAPEFNAGRGAVFNSVGGHELDASIMDGR